MLKDPLNHPFLDLRELKSFDENNESEDLLN